MSSSDIKDAVSRQDIDFLVLLWKRSLTSEDGQKVRDNISFYLPLLANELGLTFTESFKQLVEEYDLRGYKQLFDKKDLESILELLQTTPGKRTSRLMLPYLANSKLTSEEKGYVLYFILSRLDLEEAEKYITAMMPKLIPELNRYESKIEFIKGFARGVYENNDLDTALKMLRFLRKDSNMSDLLLSFLGKDLFEELQKKLDWPLPRPKVFYSFEADAFDVAFPASVFEGDFDGDEDAASEMLNNLRL